METITLKRRIASVLGASILLVVVTPGPTVHADPTPGQHTSGLSVSVVHRPSPIPSEPPAALANSYQMAVDLAMVNQDDLGYPWLDTKNEQLTLSSVTLRGINLLAQLRSDIRARQGVEAKMREVGASWRELEDIKNSVVGDPDLPNRKYITGAGPDDESNRVIVTVSELDDSLLTAMAKKYGVTSIGVELDALSQGAGTDGGGRNNNSAPFGGGARTSSPGICTTGFSWRQSDTAYAMLTAGHCGQNGGSLSTPAQYIGNIASGSYENWSGTVGPC